MADQRITLSFPDVTLDVGNQCAASLANQLKDVHKSVQVERQRKRADTMDFGATLVLLLGTAAVTEIAKGVAQWIARHRTRVELTVGTTSLTISDSDPEATAKIVRALSAKV